MPAPSPIDIKDPVLMLAISIDGSPLADYCPVESVEITQTINKIPEARLSIVFSSLATGNADMKETQKIKPGSSIVIEAGFGAGSTKASLFHGVVTKKKISMKYMLIILIYTFNQYLNKS